LETTSSGPSSPMRVPWAFARPILPVAPLLVLVEIILISYPSGGFYPINLPPSTSTFTFALIPIVDVVGIPPIASANALRPSAAVVAALPTGTIESAIIKTFSFSPPAVAPSYNIASSNSLVLV